MPREYFEALKPAQEEATAQPRRKMPENPLPAEIIEEIEAEPLPATFSALVKALHAAEKQVKAAEGPARSRKDQFIARARFQRIRRALGAMQQPLAPPVITGDDIAKARKHVPTEGTRAFLGAL